jgi:hypothetical protein
VPAKLKIQTREMEEQARTASFDDEEIGENVETGT